MTALSGTIGTGNIAGVATAIVSGGPGALFWIWAYGFVATTIKFTEAVLGVTWREASGTTIRSGPMYALRDGLKPPWLASTYALVAGVAAITTTPFTQPNSIAVVLESQLGLPTWIAGIAHRRARRGSSSSAGSARSAAPPRSSRRSRWRSTSAAASSSS